MFFKTVFSFAVIVVLVPSVVGSPWQRPQRLPRPPTTTPMEEPCVMQGGQCMRKENCKPAGNWVQIQSADLCPQQKHLGAGCCYN